MSTYTQIAYHIVFSTKTRERTLVKSHREELFGYITGILSDKKCHSYRIGGVEDHIHILAGLHPTIQLDKLVKDIKLATTAMIKRSRIFPSFGGWQNGYGAFTFAYRDLDNLVSYVMNQEEHHRTSSSREEFIDILRDYRVNFDEKYLDARR